MPLTIGYIPLPSATVTLVDSREDADADAEEDHQEDEHHDADPGTPTKSKNHLDAPLQALHEEREGRADDVLKMKFGCFGKNEDTSILVLPKTRSFAFVPTN